MPKKIFGAYHYLWALVSAVFYRFPSKRIKVIGVTGTKGKSTVVELVNAILEEAGYKTALTSTIHFKIGAKKIPNKYKMSMPGRYFMQRFLRRSVKEGCNYAIVEITSEGARQFRNKFIDLDALIFTNLSPEHIESHGSYENYRDAKVGIAKEIEKSLKSPTILVINQDDKEAHRFMSIDSEIKRTYSLNDAYPYTKTKTSTNISFRNKTISSPLIGTFNIYNMLAALVCAEAFGVNIEVMKRALENKKMIRGRLEHVTLDSNHPLYHKQDFSVIVDYAHTPDSLEKVYKTFKSQRKICVLGNTGGGRDRWKRPEMGRIASEFCEKVILTNEDPYDEDPKKIVDEMKKGMKEVKPEIIMDRREAINKALAKAEKDDVVIITGKGTDPYIMEERGKKTPWDDARVVREELEKVLK